MNKKNLIFVTAVLLMAARVTKPDELVIKEIRIEGNSYTRTSTILYFCNFKVGDRLTKEKLDQRIEKTRQKLYNTFYFYSVNVFHLPNPDPQVAVILIEVTEGFLWRFGGGPIFVFLGRDNLFGKGKWIGALLGVNVQGLEYRDQMLLSGPFIFGVSGNHYTGEKYYVENDTTIEESFKIERLAGNLRLGYQLRSDVEANLNLKIEKAWLGEKEITFSNERALGIDSDKNIIYLHPALKWDTRNRADYPGSGYYFNLSADFSRKDFGGDFDFEKEKFDGRVYCTPGLKHRIATRLRLGNSKGDTPYFYLFNIEGMEGLRAPGYSDYTGNKMFLLNLEYGFRLFGFPVFGFGEWAEGIAFFDAGRAWDEGENISVRDLNYAFGPGFRFHFPIPVFVDICLDYGFGLKRSGLYFNVKSSF